MQKLDLKREGAVLYNRERGFGFVTEENRSSEPLLQIAELNAGFDVPYWYQGERLTEILQDERGCYVDSAEITARVEAAPERLVPLIFKADVEEPGNYEVELWLYGGGEISVFAGPRRLVRRECPAGQKPLQCRFLLNVCDIIPRGKERRFVRRSIDIAVIGRQVRLSAVSIRRIDCPTLYIAGDSTVTDQPAEYPYTPGTSYAGWGQMISCYLQDKAAVSNHAHSGLTVESFRTEGHYAIVRENIRRGDYLMLQFGHNDQKLMHLLAEGGYRDGLVRYVEEARQAGAYPILVTPLARNSWKADGCTYNDLLEKYAEVCIELGREYHVPVVDLHGLSMGWIKKAGLEDAKAYFYPKDFTHTNDYGAYKMAGYVAADYRRKALKAEADGWENVDAYRRLAERMTEEPPWEGMGDVQLPVIPRRYRRGSAPEGAEVLFADLDRPEEPLTRAEALDLVIRAARLFPVNVFNDLYDDIVGHEWYAGTVECAAQNGIIPPQMTADRRLEPDKPVTLEEFLVFAMGGYKCRKRMPKESPCIFDEVCEQYSIPYVRAAFALGAVKAEEDLKGILTRENGAGICRALDI